MLDLPCVLWIIINQSLDTHTPWNTSVSFFFVFAQQDLACLSLDKDGTKGQLINQTNTSARLDAVKPLWHVNNVSCLKSNKL